jgi:hypothetical protein
MAAETLELAPMIGVGATWEDRGQVIGGAVGAIWGPAGAVIGGAIGGAVGAAVDECVD